MSDELNLAGYCGLYCGACAIYQHMIRKRGMQLLEGGLCESSIC